MKPIPLHIIVARLRYIPLPEQIELLQRLVRVERPHSVRRNELISILAGKMSRQLRRESRAA